MNEIGNTIISTEDGKAKYDATLKELLANKQFLARIMKRFVPEYADFPLEDIENRYIEPGSVMVSKIGVERSTTNIEGIANEDTTLNEGRVVYDIVFHACYPGKDNSSIGLYLIVEAQNSYYPGYPIEMRGMYYAARRLSAQLKSISNDTNYGCLQKVYSIVICMGNVPDYEAGTATLYETEKRDIIGTVKRDSGAYDLMSVIVLRINDRTKSEDEVLTLLQTVCSNLIEKDEKLKRLKEHGIRLDDEIEKGVTALCNLSNLVEIQAKKQMALKMLQQGDSYEKVAECAEVSVETVKEWEQEALAMA